MLLVASMCSCQSYRPSQCAQEETQSKHPGCKEQEEEAAKIRSKLAKVLTGYISSSTSRLPFSPRIGWPASSSLRQPIPIYSISSAHHPRFSECEARHYLGKIEFADEQGQDYSGLQHCQLLTNTISWAPLKGSPRSHGYGICCIS